jgi:hypothetical protein
MSKTLSFSVVATALLAWSSPALAHIHLTAPTSRYVDQKSGPCGSVTDARTENVTAFLPGQTITVTWDETVNHPAHYRISFDMDGQDDFADPVTQYDFYTNAAVLLDNIADSDGGSYSVDVTLPDVECTNCTLQLIQVMYDAAPYGDGNDLYFQCADLVLDPNANMPDAAPPVADAAVPPDAGSDAGMDGGGGDGGCCRVAGPRDAASQILLALATLLLLTRRRRAER